MDTPRLLHLQPRVFRDSPNDSLAASLHSLPLLAAVGIACWAKVLFVACDQELQGGIQCPTDYRSGVRNRLDRYLVSGTSA